MRIQVIGLFVFAATLGGVPPFAAAQSLADVARREEARRKSTKDGGKVYTNKDLVAVPSSGGPAGAVSTPPADSSKDPAAVPGATDGAKAVTAVDQSSVKDQAYWRKRMSDLLEQMERASAYAEAMQTRVNALTTDFTNRDDPAQRARIGVDRQKALNDLDRLKKAIVDAQTAIADLEEEARRAGVPPGWLR